MKKIEARNRRARKLRSLSEGLNVNRLAIFRSAKHIYAQVFQLMEDKYLHRLPH